MKRPLPVAPSVRQPAEGGPGLARGAFHVGLAIPATRPGRTRHARRGVSLESTEGQ